MGFSFDRFEKNKIIIIKNHYLPESDNNVTNFFGRISKKFCVIRKLMISKNPNVTKYVLSLNIILITRKFGDIMKLMITKFCDD